MQRPRPTIIPIHPNPALSDEMMVGSSGLTSMKVFRKNIQVMDLSIDTSKRVPNSRAKSKLESLAQLDSSAASLPEITQKWQESRDSKERSNHQEEIE